MPGMGEFAFSMQMRDTIARMMREEIDRSRPKYRYAVVEAIDRVARKCDVTYTGEASPVRVNMGAIQPSAIGQVVRVEGIGTDKFITDVVGEPYQYNAPRYGTVDPYYASGKAKVKWQGDTVYSGPYPVVAGSNLTGSDTVTSIEVAGYGTVIFPIDSVSGRDFQPKWHTLQLQNGWGPYTPYWHYNPWVAYNYPRVTKTAHGIVKLTGLIGKGGGNANLAAGELICTLPEGFRPAGKSMFPAQTSLTGGSGGSSEAGAIDIHEDGRVLTRNVASGWCSFENVQFPSADVAPNEAWTVPPTLLNGFQHYVDGFGGGWTKMGYWEDPEGVVWRRGLGHRPGAVPGTGLDIFETNKRPYRHHHMRVTSGNGGGFILALDNGVTHYGTPTNVNYFSLDGTHYFNRDSAVYSQRVRSWPFTNAWVDYDTANYSKSEWIKTPSGMVYLKGLMKGGTSGAIGQMPVGARPAGTALYGIISNTNSGRLDISHDGWMTGGYGYSNVWLSMDGICYIAEAEPSTL